MRNQAVHDLGEQDWTEALEIYSEVSGFVKKVGIKAEQ